MNVSLQPEPRSCLLRPIYSAISECSLSLIIPSCLNQLSHTSPPRPTYRATMWSSKFVGVLGTYMFLALTTLVPRWAFDNGGLTLLSLSTSLSQSQIGLSLITDSTIRTQRLYNTRSLHTTLGPLPGYDNLAQLGGGQCSTLIAYFYWAPIT